MGRTAIGAWPGWLGRGLLLVWGGGLGVTLKLPGVAIFVRGAVVRDPVVLEVRCIEKSSSAGIGGLPYERVDIAEQKCLH